MRRLVFILTACLCAGIASAQTKVFSPRPDSTSITIYRDGYALITETREVDLPAEAVTLVFQGVVDSLVPESAVMTGADRPLVETAFNFDRLAPETLLERSVGKVVAIVRTNPKTGRVSRLQATVVSANRGVVLRAVDGSETLQCSGVPEHLEFSEIPAELNTTPVLSTQFAAGAPGKRKISLSYIAFGFRWESDYVVKLNGKGDRSNLMGWVTLTNDTNSSFSQAQVQVVAGTLNTVTSNDYEADPTLGIVTGCYPLGNTTTGLPDGSLPRSAADRRRLREQNRTDYHAASPISMLQEVAVAGSRVVRENLADYQLYRLPWPTDLNARQTKQAVFLDKQKVKVDRFYSVRVPELTSNDVEPEGSPNLMLRWENKERTGLGEPLPAGTVRVFEPYAGGEVFAGEAQMQDRPVGLPIELAIARAIDLTSEYEQEENEDIEIRGRDGILAKFSHHFVNNKDGPVSVEVRHAGEGGYTTPVVAKSNLRSGKKYGDILWRFRIPAGAEQWLRYELKAEELE